MAKATKKATAAAPARKRAAKAKPEWKVGDRIRALRFAARGWEVGTVEALVEGVPVTAKLDDGSMVGLAGISWERQP